jgi:putative oxygen-independent coproporphyrinogen III oxidase
VIDALYCHIPFCETICPFCAFAVHGNRPALHAPVLAALEAEAERAAREHAVALAPLRAVYLGGGTPSTLALEEAAALLAMLRRHLPFATDCELAFELNPEHATPGYLRGLVALGVNRASLGLQSLDDATLRALGRHNDAAQSRRALEALRSDGPTNWNADLMFGAPECAPQAFQADVRALAALEAPHLSLYGLDIEPGTPFGRDARVQAWDAAHRDEQAETYLWAAAYLSGAGYRHYEVSNFCRPGLPGRQNEIVWDGGNYLGLGPGAHSHVDGRRWHNERHLRAYLRRVQAGEAPVAYAERLTPAQQANEALMLALRRDTGLDVAAWQARFGFPWDAPRQRLAERLLREQRASWDGTRLALYPSGLLLADEIAQALAVDEPG